MNCENCGAPVAPDDKFCTNCGTKVPLPSPIADSATTPPRFCTGCGAPVAPGTRFCEQCGTPVSATADEIPAVAGNPQVRQTPYVQQTHDVQQTPEVQQIEVEKPAKKSHAAVWTLVILAIVILAVAAMAILAGKTGKESVNSSNPYNGYYGNDTAAAAEQPQWYTEETTEEAPAEEAAAPYYFTDNFNVVEVEGEIYGLTCRLIFRITTYPDGTVSIGGTEYIPEFDMKTDISGYGTSDESGAYLTITEQCSEPSKFEGRIYLTGEGALNFYGNVTSGLDGEKTYFDFYSDCISSY